MFKRCAMFMVLGVMVLTLTGCASLGFGKKKNQEMQGLKNQVSLLESQIQSKDEEINSLKNALIQEKESAIRNSGVSVQEVKSKPNGRQIQIALKNAGYYHNNITGNVGNKTREAIRAFQKANNIQADGRVGKKTWNILKDYLEQKVK